MTKYLIFFYVLHIQSMYRIYTKRYMSYVYFVSCVVCFITFIFNSFVISYWMYFVMIEKKSWKICSLQNITFHLLCKSLAGNIICLKSIKLVVTSSFFNIICFFPEAKKLKDLPIQCINLKPF